jgi:hypothetical protein
MMNLSNDHGTRPVSFLFVDVKMRGGTIATPQKHETNSLRQSINMSFRRSFQIQSITFLLGRPI